MTLRANTNNLLGRFRQFTLVFCSLFLLGGCGLLDPITARNANGDKDKFQWDSPQALRYEAIRLGVIEKGENLTSPDIEKTLEHLVKEWFPVGTPIAEIIVYFEEKGFRHGIDTPESYGYNPRLAVKDGENYHYFLSSYYTTFFLSRTFVNLFFAAAPNDPDEKYVKLTVDFMSLGDL